MQSPSTCPLCNTPLVESRPGALTCPRCAPAAEAPWWAATPPAASSIEPGRAPPSPEPEPWWVTQPAAEVAEPSRTVLPSWGHRKSRAASLVCLLGGAVCLGGAAVGLTLLYRPTEQAAEPRDGQRVAAAQPVRKPAVSRPVQSASGVLPQNPDRPEKIASPAEALPAAEADLGGPPQLPARLAGSSARSPQRSEPMPREGDQPAPPGLPLQASVVDAAPPPEGVQPLIELLASTKKKERLRGAMGLGRYGSAARTAAPALSKVMRNDRDTAVANEAAAALARIGRTAVPHLIEGLKDEKAPVRQRAAAALALIGPEARAASPALLEALKDGSPPVRAVAAYALGEAGGDPSGVVPALLMAFADADRTVSQQAGLALVNLGEQAVPALRKALHGRTAVIRRDGARLLGMIGSDAKAAGPDLALLLQDTEPQVRAEAAKALAALGKDAQAALPALLETMRKEKRFEVQQEVFLALTLIGSRDLPGFLKAVRAVDKQGKWQSPYWLSQYGPRPEDAVKPLIQLLRDVDPGQRLAAALALGKLGLLSDESVPALLKVLDDPNPQVQVAAALSLSKLAPGDERVAALKLSAALRQLDNIIAQTQQRLTLLAVQADARSRLGELLRPLNRAAVLDPAIQRQYAEILSLHLLLTGSDCPGLKKWNAAGKGLDELISPLVDALPMEAAPAYVAALNRAAVFSLGFC